MSDLELFTAVEEGDLSKLSEVLTKQNLEKKNQNGYTPLALAAKLGNLEELKFLVSKGADVDAVNNVNF